MTAHAPVAIHPFDDGTMLVACACGNFSAGKRGATWTFRDSADHSTTCTTPSLNWPGHFHTSNPSEPIRRVDSFADLYPELKWPERTK